MTLFALQTQKAQVDRQLAELQAEAAAAKRSQADQEKEVGVWMAAAAGFRPVPSIPSASVLQMAEGIQLMAAQQAQLAARVSELEGQVQERDQQLQLRSQEIEAAREEAKAAAAAAHSATGIELLTGLAAAPGERGSVRYTDAATGYTFELRPRSGESDNEEEEEDDDDVEFAEPIEYRPVDLGRMGSHLPDSLQEDITFDRSQASFLVPKIMAAVYRARKEAAGASA